jgi:hypothetical protein
MLQVFVHFGIFVVISFQIYLKALEVLIELIQLVDNALLFLDLFYLLFYSLLLLIQLLQSINLVL